MYSAKLADWLTPSRKPSSNCTGESTKKELTPLMDNRTMVLLTIFKRISSHNYMEIHLTIVKIDRT